MAATFTYAAAVIESVDFARQRTSRVLKFPGACLVCPLTSFAGFLLLQAGNDANVAAGEVVS